MSISSFSPEQVIGLYERDTAFQQLEKLGAVWIGPDVAIEKPTIIEPGLMTREAKVILNKKDLPPIQLTRGALRSLDLSVRSFYAQTGIDIRLEGGEISDEALKCLEEGKDTPVPIKIENHGQRAVEVSGEILRLFWIDDSKRLRRKDLVDKIKAGEFTIEGIEGEDWYLGGYDENDKYTTDENGEKNALCVVVRLKPERFYIPFDPKPIQKDNDQKTRDNLASLLKNISSEENIPFEIGETPRIKLGKNIIAVINIGVNEKGQKHISSPLVDANSDWPIRTETLYGMEYVEFFLYKK